MVPGGVRADQRVVCHPPPQQGAVRLPVASSESSKPLEVITEITQELRRASVEVSDASDMSEAEEASKPPDRTVSTDSDVIHLEEEGDEEAKDSSQTGDDEDDGDVKPNEVIVQVPWRWQRNLENSSVIYTR